MNNFYTSKNVMENTNTIQERPINNSLKRSKIPPLGPTPINIFEYKCRENRIKELKTVITRYMEANYFIPLAIIEEYNKLVKDLPIEE